MFRLVKLTVQNFGPFVGKHSVDLPENGLSLIRGKVLETGDGSGAGKSYLLNAISYVLGFCPFAATELQSWYTDEPPQASLEILTDKGKLTLTRKKGLTLKSDFLPEKEYKGKAAEAQLDAVFGMDKKLREQATYRPQGAPGLFLEMDNAEKVTFLSKVLDLDKYNRVEEQATKEATRLKKQVEILENTYQIALEAYRKAFERAESHTYPDNLDGLNDQKSNVIKQLDDLRINKSSLNTRIEAVRKDISNELEAVLSTVRTKVAGINSRGESIEVGALRGELQKQQARLEKCRQYDQQQKLEVQKQRDSLKYQLKEIEVEHQKEVSKALAEMDKDISWNREEVIRLSGADKKFQELEAALGQLREQRCPTCGQTWENAKEQIQQTATLIVAVKADQAKFNEASTRLAHLEADRDQFVYVKKTELAEKLSAKKTELSNIKDPEPHPAGAQVQSKIAEITKNIKDLEATERAKKQKDLELVFAEEKDIKSQFKVKLDNEVEALQVEVFDIETAITKNQAELTKINNEIAYIAKEEAVHKELERALKEAADKMDVDCDAFRVAKEQYALESDVAALVGKQGFLGVIFADVLDEIAAQTNDILSKVANVRHLTIDFEVEKEASTSGNVTSRITPVIYSKGRKVSYKGGISGGMKTAVQLAVDLAVGNVVASRMSSYPGFLLLDESIDGLGNVSKESVIDMLVSSVGDRLVLVVDHAVEFSNLFTQVIDLEQLDGQTRIV